MLFHDVKHKKDNMKAWQDVSMALKLIFQLIIGGEAMAPEAENLWHSANLFWNKYQQWNTY